MNYNNLKISFSNNSRGLSVYLFMLFFSYSLIVSIFGYIVSQYLLTKQSDIEIDRNLKIEFKQKKILLKNL